MHLVGHSFGAAVAMKAALLLGERVKSLVLIEPNPFNLLKQEGRTEADPGTRRPIREIVELLAEACPHWRFHAMPGGGHMAPLTRPELVNLAIREFLDAPAS
jgi:pimeloyl-ACP methyl ester carboxylesterase